jgi:Ca2+-transporting ATPase
MMKFPIKNFRKQKSGISGQPQTETVGVINVNWHELSAESTISKLKTSLGQGLALDEAKNRLLIYGRNVLEESSRRSVIRIWISQFSDFMVLVLIGAALVAGFLREVEDAIAIVVVLALNAVLGFIQEYRAEGALIALKSFSAPLAQVIRSGQSRTIPASEIVPGDIVVLETGSLVPADLRLIETIQLKVDESTLTGEPHPSEKLVAALMEPELPIGDRHNIAYKGTVITHGRGVGVVFATGMGTELGRIAMLLHSQGDAKTPLQKRLTRFGQKLAMGVIALCALIFLVGILRGENPFLMFMTALSLAVAAIPESLPAVVTVSLALGAKRMLKQKALVRRLSAAETLGSVTFICSDKTGTLTQNRMQVVAYWINGQLIHGVVSGASAPAEVSRPLLEAMALNNDAYLGEDQTVHGDPTEKALFEAAQGYGLMRHELEKLLPRVGELPFSSERGQMTTLHQSEDGAVWVFTKGAPERVLSRCVHEWRHGERVSIDQGAALVAAEAMAKEGLRVLAIAHKKVQSLPSEVTSESIESELTFLAFVGLVDPPRPEVKSAIALCKSAAIQVVMITGDHPATALAVAKDLGILTSSSASEQGQVLTGQELARLSLGEFEAHVKQIRVYARVTPEQKIKIVQALQDQGEFVAMTGDGVNDAPALKRANIGVAMGRVGTDVAKEAAHMVLLDDRFATIVAAISEGRRIFDNIRKFIKFVLTGNSAEIWTLFLAPFLGLPIPFLPIHMLWINLVTDGLPGLALIAEPEEPGIMSRGPRSPQESLFAHGLWQHVLWAGLCIAGVSLAVQAWAYHAGAAHWQSMVFTVITLSQMFHVIAVRSDRESLLNQRFFSNLPLVGAVLLTFFLQMLTLYVPWMNHVFKTAPLTGTELWICLGASSIIFFAVEIEKWLLRKGNIYPQREVF